MEQLNPKPWKKAGVRESLTKTALIEDLTQRREQLYKKQIEELLEEEKQIEYFIKKRVPLRLDPVARVHFFTIIDRISKIATEKREKDRAFLQEKANLQLLLHETLEEARIWK